MKTFIYFFPQFCSEKWPWYNAAMLSHYLLSVILSEHSIKSLLLNLSLIAYTTIQHITSVKALSVSLKQYWWEFT